MNDELVAVAQAAVENIRGRIGAIDEGALDLLFPEARSLGGVFMTCTRVESTSRTLLDACRQGSSAFQFQWHSHSLELAPAASATRSTSGAAAASLTSSDSSNAAPHSRKSSSSARGMSATYS